MKLDNKYLIVLPIPVYWRNLEPNQGEYQKRFIIGVNRETNKNDNLFYSIS